MKNKQEEMTVEKQQLLEIIYKKYGSILLDKKHVQELLGLSASTINRHISNGIIPCLKLGSNKSTQVKFIITDLVEMIFTHRVEAYQSYIKGGS